MTPWPQPREPGEARPPRLSGDDRLLFPASVFLMLAFYVWVATLTFSPPDWLIGLALATAAVAGSVGMAVLVYDGRLVSGSALLASAVAVALLLADALSTEVVR